MREIEHIMTNDSNCPEGFRRYYPLQNANKVDNKYDFYIYIGIVLNTTTPKTQQYIRLGCGLQTGCQGVAGGAKTGLRVAVCGYTLYIHIYIYMYCVHIYITVCIFAIAWKC